MVVAVSTDADSTGYSFEDILNFIKPFGRWQIWMYFWLSILELCFSMTNLAVIFFQITPDYACKAAAVNKNWTIYETANISSPTVIVDGVPEPNGCRYYPVDYLEFANDSATVAYSKVRQEVTADNITAQSCVAWVYDRHTDMRETLVTQYDLVCDKKFLVEHSTLVYFLGFFIGSLIAGYLSDRFGRKKVLVFFGMGATLFGVIQGFLPNYYLFLLVRFFLALCNIGATMGAFCLAMESTNAYYRNWVGGLFFMPYAVGYSFLPAVAFLLRDWRFMHAACALPGVMTVFFWWLLPESPRWLLVRGRAADAERELRRANDWNGGSLPDHIDFERLAHDLSHNEKQEKENAVSVLSVFAVEKGRFKYPTMVGRACNIFFNWFVNSMVYYGITLNVSSFAGNRFINNFIAGAVEIPGYAICVPLLYWGRRPSLSAMLLLAGCSLFIVPWFPEESHNWLRITFAMTGKLAITASFALVYVFTPELYPTVIRNSGLATSSCVSRFGSMLAPYISTGITKVDESLDWMPLIIYGVFSVAAGLLTLFLPETKGKKMPEHLDDIKAESKRELRFTAADNKIHDAANVPARNM